MTWKTWKSKNVLINLLNGKKKKSSRIFFLTKKTAIRNLFPENDICQSHLVTIQNSLIAAVP